MNIDSLKDIQKVDKSGMLGIIESFPEQAKEANGIGRAFSLPASFKVRFRNVVCAGLGGSAIGADIARSLTQDEIKIPLSVNRNYTLPGFAGRDSLVIVSSYSGNTEETLGAYRDAKRKKAAIVAITSGGALGDECAHDGNPFIRIPPGLPPRCALGYSFFPLLILLSKFKLIGDKSADIRETIGLLEGMKKTRLGMPVKGEGNAAKSLAAAIRGRFPVVYSACDRIDSVATRWRGQLAENSKTLASSHLFPEMCHNEIVGWENPAFMLKGAAAVFLRDRGDSKRVARRMDIVRDILDGRKVKTFEVSSTGKSLLARIFSLIYTGDFISFYLAILNGCDPTPVKRIDYLKERLARS